MRPLGPEFRAQRLQIVDHVIERVGRGGNRRVAVAAQIVADAAEIPAEMLDHGRPTQVDGPVLLVERVPHDAVHRYGIIDATPVAEGVFQVRDLVEKPAPEAAPSDLAIVGRYILTPDVFADLEQTGEGAGGEIQLTDGLRRLLERRPLYACELTGIRHDAGTPLGFIQAALHFALKRPDLEPALRAHLRTLT